MTPTRRLAAIMAADVAGFSAAMERDEEGTYARLQELRQSVIEPKLAEHLGRLIKTTGDGFLAEFASPIAATRCALAIQGELAGAPLQLRIGLNLGDVIVEESGDVYGEGVNIAARLEALADAGGILISAKVFGEVEGKIDASFADRGEQQVKNIARPVRVFAVSTAGPSPSLVGPAVQSGRINLVLGTGQLFEVLQPSGVNLSRIVRVKIENHTGSEIADGELRVLNLDPPPRGHAEWLLKKDIMIGPRKHAFVEVAAYAQGTSEANPGTWMNLIVPPGGAFFAEALPLLPLKPHTFQLKFSSLEHGLFDEVFCRLYVDIDRVLRLENQIIPPLKSALVEPTWISLFEAATRAYEALRHYDVVIAEEAWTNSPNEILIKVCEMLCRAQKTKEPLVKPFGNKPPSRIREEVYMAPLDKYEFVVEGNSIVLVGHKGADRYENLVADAAQVEAAILEIERRHEP